MAKRYSIVVIEGHTLEDVEGALASIVGPLLEQWRGSHLFGIRIDISDVSDAVRYGMEFEEEGRPTPIYPVVEIDIYADTLRETSTIESALIKFIAAKVKAELGTAVSIRYDN